MRCRRNVSRRLKAGTETIADYSLRVGIPFAGVVGFTVMSSGERLEKIMGMRDDIFSRFDRLAEQYGMEKIRVIGDRYIAVRGVPVQREHHAHRLANIALGMRAYMPPEVDGGRCRTSIGINSGDMIAGVVGTTKFP